MAIALLAAAPSLPLASAEHVQAVDGKEISFDHKTGNEWWVEVVLGGASKPQVGRVQAMDDGGPWTDLTLRSWGAWAGSFRIEPGHRVVFRALFADGAVVQSCPFTHPAGQEQCGPATPFAAATYLGGSMYEAGRAVDIGPDGSVYVTGETGSRDFGNGASGSDFDVFVSRLAPDLSSVTWTRVFGGSHFDNPIGLQVAADGSVYVTGDTRSIDFPVTAGAYDTTWNDRTDETAYDAFVAKLRPDGSLAWATFLGGAQFDSGRSVDVDAQGRPVVIGSTYSCAFPTTAGTLRQRPAGCIDGQDSDAFVAVLSADGTRLEASTLLGSTGFDRAWAGALAPDGTVVVHGLTTSADFPVTPDAYRTTKGDGQVLFLARLDAALRTILDATFFGSADAGDWPGGVAVASDNSVLIVGETSSTSFPATQGAFQTTLQSPTGCADGPSTYNGPCSDGYAARFSPDLSRLVYATYVGGSSSDALAAVAVDGAGRAHMAGSATSPGLAPAANGADYGYNEGFYGVLSADGSRLERAESIGGSDWDEGTAIAWRERAAIVGWVGSSDFATTPGAADRSLGGYQDAFVVVTGAPPTQVTFDHKGGNEWWVEATVSGATPTRVQAMDTGGAWTELTLRSWGAWAGSFRIEPGHQVRFRALVGGTWSESCWFTHPQGNTPAGGQTCAGTSTPAPPPDTTQWYWASFWGVKGNEWWVEARVDGPVTAVDARVNGGTWQPLTFRSWGAWAGSFHVPAGSIVQLRSLRSDGAYGFHVQGFVWPTAEPYPGYGGTTFDAAFHNVKGNAGYQQVNVYATALLEGVKISIAGGPWQPMERKAWGDWASSLPVPAGATVRFQAVSGTGSETSATYTWPPA